MRRENWLANIYVVKEMDLARKRRNDRYHLIYQLTSPNGDRYIGVTFDRGDSRSIKARNRSAQTRFAAHCRNALDYGHNTILSQSIRENGPDSFLQEVVEVIRGKQAVHNRERELISIIKPELNMEGMGRKVNSMEQK